MATKTSIDIDSKGAEAKRSLYNEQPTYLTQIKNSFIVIFVATICNIALSDIKGIVHLSILQRTRLIPKSQLVPQLLDQPQFNPLCTQVLYQRSSINLMPLIRRQQLPRSWSNNVLVSKVKSLGFNWLVLAHSTRWPDLCDSSTA